MYKEVVDDAKQVIRATPNPSLQAQEVSSIPSKNLDRQQVKEQAMLDAGVTRKNLYDRIYEGINYGVWVTEADENGDAIKVFKPDMNVRHKYVETGLRVLGDLKPDSVVDNSKTFNLTVGDRQAMVTRLRNILDVPGSGDGDGK